MTGVVQEVVGKRRYLVRFQDGLEKDMSQNHLTIVVVRSEVEEDIEVREVDIIPEVREELGCYRWVYIYLHFVKEYGVDKRQDQVCVEKGPDEEYIGDVVLDDERQRHWLIVFEENNVGVDGTKALLHAKKWDVYNSEKEALLKGGYSVEVSEKDRKKVIWEVVDNHVVQEGVEHEELGLRGFGFNLFNEEREGCVGDDVKELPYFLVLMKLWPQNQEDQLDRMKKSR